MLNIRLVRPKERDAFDENRVLSKLILTERNGIKTIIPILENRKYMPIEGIYELRYELSPKFGVKLWEFYGVKGRNEIKFHHGKNIGHSRGCPLGTVAGINTIDRLLDSNKDYHITVKTE